MDSPTRSESCQDDSHHLSSSIPCTEIFDESCQPSTEEINEYAKLIGIDPTKEPDLIWLAKEGLMRALPRDWKICYSEEKCGHYYYNSKTKLSQWDHPLDSVYRERVQKFHRAEYLKDTPTEEKQPKAEGQNIQSDGASITRPKSLNSRFQINRVRSESCTTPKLAANSDSGSKQEAIEEATGCKSTDDFNIPSPDVKGILRTFSVATAATVLHNNPGHHECDGYGDNKKSVRFRLADKPFEGTIKNVAELESNDSLAQMTQASGGEQELKTNPVKVTNPFLDNCESIFFDTKAKENAETTTRELRNDVTIKNHSSLSNTHPSIRNHPAWRLWMKNAEPSSSSSSGQLFGNGFIDLDTLERKHSNDVEQLKKKINFLSMEQELLPSVEVTKRERLDARANNLPLAEREREFYESHLEQEVISVKKEYEQRVSNARHEYEVRLASHQHQMDESLEEELNEYRIQLAKELERKKTLLAEEHDQQLTAFTHAKAEKLKELQEEFKTEIDTLKNEHFRQLKPMREKLLDDCEQLVEAKGGDKSAYDKVCSEKRLLEDKYRCLKDKYVRLKTDVKLSLERRNRRRHTNAQKKLANFPGSEESERLSLNKDLTVNTSDNCSMSLSASFPDQSQSHNHTAASQNRDLKPFIFSKTYLITAMPNEGQNERRSAASVNKPDLTNESSNAGLTGSPSVSRSFINCLPPKLHDDNLYTSNSQSDTTISNNYKKTCFIIGSATLKGPNGNSGSESRQFKKFQHQEDNNNATQMGIHSLPNQQQQQQQSQQQQQQQQQHKRSVDHVQFASTSRPNQSNSGGYRSERSSTSMESLHHQLQKLEDLEDQLPENTMDTTIHLRYPFTDVWNERADTCSELEFYKHRIHMERDSVRRAKEALRMQRHNFRVRQNEIKQRYKSITSCNAVLDQLVQEEKELTEMEVTLHRTRALLGEKIIRLRHLEESLLRIYKQQSTSAKDLFCILEQQKNDATLSDVSSHSSSGFSSVDFASFTAGVGAGCALGAGGGALGGGGGGVAHNVKEKNSTPNTYYKESTEHIQNIEILNAEIREILGILGKSQRKYTGN